MNTNTFITSRSVMLDPELDQWVKQHKQDTGKPMSRIYYEALKLYQEKQEQQQSPNN